MKNMLLIEEKKKANANQLQMAIDELVNKFSMLDPIFFDSIQFMICYAAAGYKIFFLRLMCKSS